MRRDPMIVRGNNRAIPGIFRYNSGNGIQSALGEIGVSRGLTRQELATVLDQSIPTATEDTTEDIPYGYCHCGCGQKTRIVTEKNRPRGYLKGEPLRFIDGHSRRKYHPTYKVDPETGCWNWQGRISPGGYGQMSLPGKTKAIAHRVFYERENGPIPDGFHVHHDCKNRRCVNPAHLRVGSPVEHGRIHAKKLNYASAERIRQLRQQDVPARSIANLYGIHPHTVHAIMRGDRWGSEE